MNEENFTSTEQTILEPKKNNMVLIVIVFVIVAITAGVIGFLLAKKTQAPATEPAATQPVTVQQPTTEPVGQKQPAEQPVVSTARPVVDETADWKTYVNDSFGLSFKYPQTYTIESDLGFKAGGLGRLSLVDKSRAGIPSIDFIIPDGRGGSSPTDIIYDTVIENGKITINNRRVLPKLGEYDSHLNDDKTYIEFEIGKLYGPTGSAIDSKYSATSGNGILVWFFYDKTENYEQEFKDIISTITITKPEIYGKK